MSSRAEKPRRTARAVRALMHVVCLAVLVAASIASVPAAGKRASVVHPALRARPGAGFAPGRAPFQYGDRLGFVRAKVRTSDPDLFAREATRLGIEIRALAGGVASVEIPETMLDEAAELPGVVSIKPPHPYLPLLDVSRAETGAGIAASSYGGTGRDVIVAIIDTGLDFRQRDFRNADGTTRVLAAWDQTDSSSWGDGCPPPVSFGRCWSRTELDADLAGGPIAGLRDGHGHGTHVAGIAAGNGLAAANGVPPGTYAGVAREADLLIVKVFTDSGYLVGDLTAAYGWIEQQAVAAGKPFVINMSLGWDLGAHDGSDPDEVSLDAILAPGIAGRAAAIAAGNSRGIGIHVEGTAPSGNTNEHPFVIPTYSPLGGASNDVIYMDLWYEGGDDLTVSVLDAAGAVLATATRGASSGVVCSTKGAIDIDATNTTDPDNLDSEVFVSISDSAACSPAVAPPPGQTLKLRVSGASSPHGGGYHVWSQAFLGPLPAHVTFTPAAESTLAGSPATSRRATTTGAYVTRSCWPNADPNSGTTCRPLSAALGAASGFSSNGPTRDGRPKPDVSAPGEWIVSSLSAAVPASLNQKSLDGLHWGLRGTSMASPHAAGALAVLLQLNPNLDAVEARSLLAVSSRGDAFTGVVPNMLYGWGKIFVPEGAAAAVKPVPDVSVGQGGSIAWTAEPHSVTYNLYRGSLPFTFPASYGACLQSSLPGTSWSDPAAPPPGSGYTYLVTGVKDGIEGSFGLDSAGGTRLNVAPCP